jgi:microcystin-dependent protein
MSTCSNCYNGCTEIVSDRCVKYTGIDVPVLGIQTGDSLSFVEQALITFLTSTLDGTGVKIDLAPTVVCELVQQYLPTCGDLSIVDISKALIQAACDLQLQVDAIVAELAILNADYTIGCLTGVTASSDTHAIVQAVITKLCQIEVNLVALALDLSTNYSSNGAELDAYIANYLTTTFYNSNLISNRMVPYSVVEYYGPIAGNFDGTGAGIVGTNWEKIYLCNGLNGTPDKRGVVGVGVTDGSMLGNTMPAVTNPSLGNPTYSISATILGTNNVTLNLTQIPAHTHIATSTVTPNPHSHGLSQIKNHTNNFGLNGFFDQALGGADTASTTDSVSLSVSTINSSEGGGLSHPNFQPGLGCYYIQYRP